eukprot:253580-Pyramimonas_sp.AAC.1
MFAVPCRVRAAIFMVSALATVATRSRRASRYRLVTRGFGAFDHLTIPRASARLQWLQVDDELIFALMEGA